MQLRAAATGPAGHYAVCGHGPGPDHESDSPKHWRVRAVPVRNTSSWVCLDIKAGVNLLYRTTGEIRSVCNRADGSEFNGN